MAIEERPIKLSNPEDTNRPENFEKLFSHYDQTLRKLDQRRIAKQSRVEEGATDSETIQNLLTAVNALINALNNSELTK